MKNLLILSLLVIGLSSCNQKKENNKVEESVYLFKPITPNMWIVFQGREIHYKEWNSLIDSANRYIKNHVKGQMEYMLFGKDSINIKTDSSFYCLNFLFEKPQLQISVDTSQNKIIISPGFYGEDFGIIDVQGVKIFKHLDYSPETGMMIVYDAYKNELFEHVSKAVNDSTVSINNTDTTTINIGTVKLIPESIN